VHVQYSLKVIYSKNKRAEHNMKRVQEREQNIYNWMWNEYRRGTEHIQKRNKMDTEWGTHVGD